MLFMAPFFTSIVANCRKILVSLFSSPLKVLPFTSLPFLPFYKNKTPPWETHSPPTHTFHKTAASACKIGR